MVALELYATYFAVAGGLFVACLIMLWLGVRYIPNSKVGIVEKIWSAKGSLSEGGGRKDRR